MATSKYKIGDKVLIKDLDWYIKNKDPFGDVKTEHTYFRDFMSYYCGKMMTIKNISTILNNTFYCMEEDSGLYCWEDEMIENKISISKSQNPPMLYTFKKDTNMVEDLTYEEKVESILSTLATPIYRRRINDEGINKLITEAYLEMKEYKRLRSSGEWIPAGPKAQETDKDMITYDDNPEEYFLDYDVDEMFPEHEYGCIDIIN